MRNGIKFLLLICLFLVSNAFAITPITYYQQTFMPVYSKQGKFYIAIRYFQQGDQYYYLTVDPENLQTSVQLVNVVYNHDPKSSQDRQKSPDYFEWKNIKNTPYIKALWQETAAPYPLQNDGLTHALYPLKGYFLTIDMCPSINPMEQDFFNQLVKLALTQEHAMPIAISISGLWLLDHPKEFSWLLTMQEQHKLDITWVNHTLSHLYLKDLPLAQNFLLFPQTNFMNEVFAVEKLLLEHGQVPSVFFRFPGLVSNKTLILKLRFLGLIPLGADAWLAKGQTPEDGSIILVHGNGNEHAGIVKVMPYLHDQSISWLPIVKLLTQ